MRNTLESSYNRTVHGEDTDAESALRAQHAALAKMAQMPNPVQAPTPVPSVTPTPSITPQAAPIAPETGPMAHPAFSGLMNAIRRPRASNPVKLSPGIPGLKVKK